jgi:excisionase family DNA binding protein
MNDSATRPDLLTVPQAATRLAVTPGAIRRWIVQRRLRPVKLGRAVRLRTVDVERAINEGIPPRPQNRP